MGQVSARKLFLENLVERLRWQIILVHVFAAPGSEVIQEALPVNIEHGNRLAVCLGHRVDSGLCFRVHLCGGPCFHKLGHLAFA